MKRRDFLLGASAVAASAAVAPVAVASASPWHEVKPAWTPEQVRGAFDVFPDDHEVIVVGRHVFEVFQAELAKGAKPAPWRVVQYARIPA